MPHFGNVPAETLVDTVEKLVARMDEGELVATLGRESASMPPDALRGLVEVIFHAFRERGESSEDVAEEAGATLQGIAQLEPPAVSALLAYAGANTGVVKEATALFVEHHPQYIEALPSSLRDAIAQRLAGVTGR
ncbi:MAG: hypothetical protein ACLQPV_01135 [Vulcanimicrobiaceae bacterium]